MLLIASCLTTAGSGWMMSVEQRVLVGLASLLCLRCALTCQVCRQLDTCHCQLQCGCYPDQCCFPPTQRPAIVRACLPLLLTRLSLCCIG